MRRRVKCYSRHGPHGSPEEDDFRDGGQGLNHCRLRAAVSGSDRTSAGRSGISDRTDSAVSCCRRGNGIQVCPYGIVHAAIGRDTGRVRSVDRTVNPANGSAKRGRPPKSAYGSHRAQARLLPAQSLGLASAGFILECVANILRILNGLFVMKSMRQSLSSVAPWYIVMPSGNQTKLPGPKSPSWVRRVPLNTNMPCAQPWDATD